MGHGNSGETGKACYKALLAAATPVDFPMANVLCCPLFWRAHKHHCADTRLTEMGVEAIFWKGARAVNGFFVNFSDADLKENSDCSEPFFSGTVALCAADDRPPTFYRKQRWIFTQWKRQRASKMSTHKTRLTTPSSFSSPTTKSSISTSRQS
ncbi:hypothetical protein ABL78_6323 [Leptomonas seymouri]|uniref:Uncharacterized protein n=1 Tax=Leptomonas seymouri TaxID=5684 RepID=A0A0N1HVK1_LEPSE|nr:hypothetical protein ABL78_6323 [Leptomonas seymouri]|eukprot:KPI84618.1 hypothetical protein ABL78_6323 [Leptomonas seymouri]